METIIESERESEKLALSLMDNVPLHFMQLMVQYNNTIKQKGLDMKPKKSGESYMLQNDLLSRNLIDLRLYQKIHDETGEFVVLKYYQTKAVESTNENSVKDSQDFVPTVTILKSLKIKFVCNNCKNYDHENRICNDQQVTATKKYPSFCKSYIFTPKEKVCV